MTVPIPSTGSDVLPPQDAAYGLFVNAFAAAWVPATFNAVLPTAASLVILANDFNAALVTSTDPATRTPVTVADKDTERAIASIAFRAAIRAAQSAYLAGTVSEAQLNALGVRANSLIRTPVNAPSFAPLLASDGSLTGQTRLRLTQVDPTTGVAVTTRGFARNIIGVEVQRKVGSGDWMTRFTAKRTKLFDVTTDVAVGTVLLYRSRYITATGLVGPFSSSATAVAA